jgi:hypothetical protein
MTSTAVWVLIRTTSFSDDSKRIAVRTIEARNLDDRSFN